MDGESVSRVTREIIAPTLICGATVSTIAEKSAGGKANVETEL